MIAKIAIPLTLLILLPQLYFYFTFWRRGPWHRRLLLWLPALLLVGATWWLALQPDYFPDRLAPLTLYLHAVMVIVVPAALLAVGIAVGRMLKPRRPAAVLWANALAWGLPVAVAAGWIYGSKVGFRQFEVRHVELSFKDLPEAFDGYKIVQFSDAHVGTLNGSRQQILQRCIDSINAQHADAVVFTGDLQNKAPHDVWPHRHLLSSIQTRDGVFSVLGNHDYPMYLSCDEFQAADSLLATERMQFSLGWHLLLNRHHAVHRGADSIVIAGMENYGEPPFPRKGDVIRSLWGVSTQAFVVMLQHDPTAWRRTILPDSRVQLTLSGHTHAGQFSVFGWTPASLRYRECQGLYRLSDERSLYVTKGLGGVIPFRLGAPGEIVVITLRRAEKG